MIIEEDKMNILIFSHSSRLGGAERSLLTLVKDLVQTYHTQVTVVLPHGGPSVDLLQNAGAATITGPLHWLCTGEEMLGTDEINQMMSESFDWILDQIYAFRQLNPDVILTNTMVIPWGAFAAALMKRPHIWMVNEFGELDHGFNFYLPFKQVLSLIEQASDVIVTRSDAIKETLFPHLGPDKIKTIYRSIELHPKASAEEADKSVYFELPSACKLAIIGTIRKQKGQQDAVNAVIELVTHRHRQVELVMAGHIEEDFRAELEQIAQQNEVNEYVHILPFQKNVLKIIDQADIVLVCSRLEAFGRVILESMVLEKPVISTNTGGTPEMIADGETGLLYTPGDISQLVDQIEKLINDPELRQKLAKNGFEFASATFTKEKYAGEYQKLFELLAHQEYQFKSDIAWFLVDHFQNLLNHKNKEIDHLKEQNQNLKQEVLSYASSKSWALTRPIRKIKQRLRRS